MNKALSHESFKRYFIQFHPRYSQCPTMWFEVGKRFPIPYKDIDSAMDRKYELEKTFTGNLYFVYECVPIYCTEFEN